MATSDHRPTIHTPASTEHNINFQEDKQLGENELAMLIRGGSSLLSILKPNVGPPRRNRLASDDTVAIAQADRIATLFAGRDTVEVAAIAYVLTPAGTVIHVLTIPQEAPKDDPHIPIYYYAARNSCGDFSSQSISHPIFGKTPSAQTTWLKTILKK